MKFYIVTPTFNSLHWLRCCIRSVADQVAPGIEVHHHVQDGLSKDGTVAWLEAWKESHAETPGYTFTYDSRNDVGMYDAINKAWDAMPMDAGITAHLNSDEQYLPGALVEVAYWMQRKAAAEVLLGTYIIADAENKYICHRRPVMPRAWSSWLNCACITNSSFYRAASFRRREPRFDTRWRCISDLVFFRDLTQHKVVFACIPVVTSLFVCTGENLAWTNRAHEEWLSLHADVPWLLRIANGLIYRWVNFKRRLVDMCMSPPREYAVYAADDESRVLYSIKEPTSAWNRK